MNGTLPSPGSAALSTLAGMTGGLATGLASTAGLSASQSLITGTATTSLLDNVAAFGTDEYLLDTDNSILQDILDFFSFDERNAKIS